MVKLRMEGVVVDVVERLVRRVLALAEHDLRVPVVPFARQVVTPLEQQHALAGLGDPGRCRTAARPAADHDDVVVLGA